MKIIEILVRMCIGTLPRDPQRHILKRSNSAIIITLQAQTNLRQDKIISSIANSKVEIFRLPFKVCQNQYDLYMKVDTNTNGHRQWFFFSIRNNKTAVIKLNIFRFKKRFSLYQRGLKPYICSVKAGNGWAPGGINIRYRKERAMELGTQSKTYYLTFQYKFQLPEDEVFFCCGIPYTYSHLQKRLLQLENKSTQISSFLHNKLIFKVQEAGKSLCGLQLPVVTVEANNSKSKRFIVINARTHAGEFSSSWVMDGVLKKLVEEEEIHEWIIQNDISFKIIPMLNPDGVFVGNYRTGIVGDDFNRRFASGKKEIFPEISYLKKVISECKKNGKVYMFLDLHGHSILKNTFIYGPIQNLFANNPLRSLAFNLWHSSKYFQFSSCKFRFEKDLTETARVFFQLKENILTYTSETSLGLYKKSGKSQQMLSYDFISFGGAIINAISELMVKNKLEKELIMPAILPEMKRQNTDNQLERSRDISKRRSNTKSKKTDKYFNQTIVDRKKIFYENLSINKGLCLDKIEKNKEKQDSKKNFDVPRKSIKKNSETFFKNKPLELGSQKISTSVGARKYSEAIQKNQQQKKISLHMTGQTFYNSFKKKQDTQEPEQEDEQSKNNQKTEDIIQTTQKFKIRRKADIGKRSVPESFRKKLGTKVFLHLRKNIVQENISYQEQQQSSFKYQRSVTYDSSYLSSQLPIKQQNKQQTMRQHSQGDLDIIDQKFSEEYQSINDSDSSSEDLDPNKKQYLIQCIRNNRRLWANNDGLSQNQVQEQHIEDQDHNGTTKINRFKQIQFKSLERKNKQTQGLRPTKREIHKFRQMTHKSLNRGLYDDDSQTITNIVQKKQLNARVHKKTQREPYFLVQIKSKQN